jgi:hypothetical protein|nr:MAG TPA: hypothetical protein [Caudoviricetes sp.]
MARMLSTVDNPYDPRTSWDEWFAFDTSHGYWTCGLLARFVDSSSSLSDELDSEEIENAIDRILKFDGTNFYQVFEVDD